LRLTRGEKVVQDANFNANDSRGCVILIQKINQNNYSWTIPKTGSRSFFTFFLLFVHEKARLQKIRRSCI